MALPTLQKTWEFKTNWYVHGSYTFDTLAQFAACDIKDLLCDFIPRLGAFAEGSFTFSSPTVTYTAPDTRFDPTLVGNIVGKTARVKGATSSGNDGSFTITAQTSSTIEWSNASGAAEALAGSINIINGDFTAPWVLDHTGTDTAHGSAGDGIDRLAGDPTRLGGGTGNVGYFVIKNTATGTYWGFSSDSNSNTNGDRAGHGVWIAACAPNTLLAPTGLTEPPRGPLLEDGVTNGDYIGSNNTDWWFADTGGAYSAATVKFHVMMSNDGQQTRLIGIVDSLWTLAFMDGIVSNPHPSWNVGGGIPTPAVTVLKCTNVANPANNWAIADFNDSSLLRASAIPWPLSGVSPTGGNEVHHARFYLSGEGYGAALNTQNYVATNTLTGAYDIFPVGLFTLTTGVTGRHGELPDIWWIGTDANRGDTFPDNTSRQFLCAGDLVLPWNGDYPEIS